MPPHRCQRERLLACVLLWLPVALAVRAASGQFAPVTSFELADATLDEVGASVESDLASIRELLVERQWNEAVDRLARLTETGDAKLIHLSDNRYITLRRMCHRLIGRLPPEAIVLYRRRVDPLAETWYRQGVAERDAVRLRRVVDTVFCSTWGDNALYALGELALQRGDHATARSYWERISPLLRGPEGRPLWLALRDIDLDANWNRVAPILLKRESTGVLGENMAWLAYPDTDLLLSDVRFRLVLTSIHERSLRRAEVELAAFSKMHPEAKGRFGGRQVVLADALTDLLIEARSWPAPSPVPGWPTFAGAPERTGRAPPAVTIAGPAWKTPVVLKTDEPKPCDTRQRIGFSGRRIGEDANRPLSFHPTVVGDIVFYCDKQRIHACHLATGEPAFTHDGVLYNPSREPSIRDPLSRGRATLGVPRFTMTAHAGRLYARLGEPITNRSEIRTVDEKRLVGLDLTRGGMLMFEVAPDDGPNRARWSFEGSPVADDRNVYVAMRQSDVSPRASVACLDGLTGKMKWRTYIASGGTPAQPGRDEITHNLLTLHENTIYYNTNLGVVAALSTKDGIVHWVARYDRAKRGNLSSRAAHFYRDLTPCIYDNGLLFVAPADSPYIFALDAATGQTMWATDLADDVVHLLGVADGNLIASGDRLWWLNTQTGKVAAPPWPENRKSGIRGHGRGMIAGDRIYWPTQQAEILVFGTTPKTRPDEVVQPIERIDLASHNAESGNVLAVDDFLLVATPDKLFAFSQFPRERERLLREVTERFDDPAAHLRFAQCERAMAHCDNAAEHYRRAIKLSRGAARVRIAASRELTTMLLTLADTLARRGNMDTAIAKADEALRFAATSRDRVAALLHAAEIEAAAEMPVEAIARWQRILADETLAGYPVAVAGQREVAAGREIAARLVAKQRIDAMIEAYGKSVYVRTEAEAIKHFTQSHRNTTSDVILRIARRYPNAEVTRSRLPARYQREVSGVMTPSLAIQPPLRIANSYPVSGHTMLADAGQSVIATADTLLTVERAVMRGVSLESGSVRWQRPISSPIVDAATNGKYAFVATVDSITCVHIDLGQVVWSVSETKGKRIARISLASDNRLDVLRKDGTLLRYKATTGRPLWKRDDSAWQAASLPLVHGRYLLLQQSRRTGRPDGERICRTVLLNPTTGQVERLLPFGRSVWTRRPLIYDRTRLLIVDIRGNVRLVDLAWGEVVWSRRAARLPASQPEVVLADDALLLFNGIGDLVRINPVDGSAMWQKPVAVGPQILAQPRRVVAWDAAAVYLVSAGKLKAFSLDDGRPHWPDVDVRIATEERRWRWRTHRFGPYIITHPIEFAEPDGFHFVISDASTGQTVFRSSELDARPGEARVVWYSDHAVLVGGGHVWKIEY